MRKSEKNKTDKFNQLGKRIEKLTDLYDNVIVDGNELKLDMKEMSDYLIEEDKDKPVKIIHQYEYCDLDNHLKTDYLIGKAKNRTIGEIWKGIDRIMFKHSEDVFGDHRFIESLIYKDNQIEFYTGS